MKPPDRFTALVFVVMAGMACAGIWLLVFHYRQPLDQPTLLPPAYARVPITATPLMQCESLGTGCRKVLLGVINADRAAVGSPPLALDATMTYGATPCIGAAGHAKHMAEQQQMSHDQFPGDVCSLAFGPLSENVGASPQPDRWSALLQIHQLMMSEPYTPGCLDDHRCSLMYPSFRRIGIGYRRGGGALYLAETFSG